MVNPTKLLLQFHRRISDLDWRLVLFLLLPLSLLLYVSFSSISSATTVRLVFNSFSSFTPFRSIFIGNNETHANDEEGLNSPLNFSNESQIISPISLNNGSEMISPITTTSSFTNESESNPPVPEGRKNELKKARIAVCLVGGARRFELTGPSIIENILNVYRNSDLFLHSPLDSNAYKLSLLKDVPSIAAVKIFQPESVPATDAALRVLTSSNSPNGIQGLLQYFNLVEGCLNMIYAHQRNENFTYDWIIRTRVDGYWSNPLGPESFVPGYYFVPSGSSYGGLNDRLGVGDLNTSIVAISRLSLLPVLDSAEVRQANSEKAFKAQLITHKVKYIEARFPFCVMSDRQYDFPPGYVGVPVASISSPGPLSGVKCRPCKAVCKGVCAGRIMDRMAKRWSWTDWANNSLNLCDGHGPWEDGWEKIFDRIGGKKLANERKRMKNLKMEECLIDFEKMRNRAAFWETPPVEEICRLGLMFE